MAFTKTEVSKLYVALFNRAAEKAGSEFWQQTPGTNQGALANAMLNTAAAREFYPELSSNKGFVDALYANVFSKGPGVDEAGKAYWVNELNTKSRGDVVVAIINAGLALINSTDPATKAAAQQLQNRIEISDFAVANGVDFNFAGNPNQAELNALRFDRDLRVTGDSATLAVAKQQIESLPAPAAAAFSLTTNADNITGTAGNDVITALPVTTASVDATTLNRFDKINGGAGIDTLELVVTEANNRDLLGTVSNVERILVTGSDNLGLSAEAARDLNQRKNVRDEAAQAVADQEAVVAAAEQAVADADAAALVVKADLDAVKAKIAAAQAVVDEAEAANDQAVADADSAAALYDALPKNFSDTKSYTFDFQLDIESFGYVARPGEPTQMGRPFMGDASEATIFKDVYGDNGNGLLGYKINLGEFGEVTFNVLPDGVTSDMGAFEAKVAELSNAGNLFINGNDTGKADYRVGETAFAVYFNLFQEEIQKKLDESDLTGGQIKLQYFKYVGADDSDEIEEVFNPKSILDVDFARFTISAMEEFEVLSVAPEPKNRAGTLWNKEVRIPELEMGLGPTVQDIVDAAVAALVPELIEETAPEGEDSTGGASSVDLLPDPFTEDDGSIADNAIVDAIFAAAQAPGATPQSVLAAALNATNRFIQLQQIAEAKLEKASLNFDAAVALLAPADTAFNAAVAAVKTAEDMLDVANQRLVELESGLANAEAAINGFSGPSALDASFFKGSTTISLDGETTNVVNAGEQTIVYAAGSGNIDSSISYLNGTDTANVKLANTGGRLDFEAVGEDGPTTLNVTGSTRYVELTDRTRDIEQLNLSIINEGARVDVVGFNSLTDVTVSGDVSIGINIDGDVDSVTTGAGNDQVTISPPQDEDGEESFFVGQVRSTDLAITTKAGDDVVNFSVFSEYVRDGGIAISTGEGNDVLNAAYARLSASGAIAIDMGAGKDFVSFVGSSLNASESVSVDLGEGDDELDVISAEVISGAEEADVLINGGAGIDRLIVGNVDQPALPIFTSFEILDARTSGTFEDVSKFTTALDANSNNVVFQNVTAGTELVLGDGAKADYQLADATGIADAATVRLEFANGTANATLAGIETVNVVTMQSMRSGASATLNLSDVNARSLVIEGGGAIAVALNSSVNLKTVDASKNLGSVDLTKVSVASTGASISGSAVAASGLLGADGADTITGGAGNDSIVGGKGNDVITSGAGADTVSGGEGNDVITAGDGNDSVDGGVGDDTLTVGSGNDNVIGGDGNDVISAGDGNDTVDGGAGNDVITAGDGNDTVIAGEGSNSVTAGNGNDSITAGAGNDTIVAGEGNDTIEAGAGNDTITAGDGNDVITVVATDGGSDTVNGGAGLDRVNVTAKPVNIDTSVMPAVIRNVRLTFTSAEVGNNDAQDGANTTAAGTQPLAYAGAEDGGLAVRFQYEDNAGLVTGETGVKTTDTDTTKNVGALSRFDDEGILFTGAANQFDVRDLGLGANRGNFQSVLLGTSGNDTFVYGKDFLAGLDANGNIYINAGAGNDSLVGGDGNDASDFLVGGAGNDTLTGLKGNDTLLGGTGNDSLSGGEGNDLLNGGVGTDMIDIGTGSDIIQFAAGDSTLVLATADTVVGFQKANDKLKLGLAGDDVAANGVNFAKATTAAADFSAALAAANADLLKVESEQTVDNQVATNYAFQFTTVDSVSTGFLFIDYNRDGTADQMIVLAGVNDLDATNIIA